MTKSEDRKRAEEIAKKYVGGIDGADILNRRKLCADAICAYAEEAFARGQADMAAKAENAIKVLYDEYAVKNAQTYTVGLLWFDGVAKAKQAIKNLSPNPSYAEEVRAEQREADALIAEIAQPSPPWPSEEVAWRSPLHRLITQIAAAIRNGE